jgi:hypothetical protein
LFLNDESPGDEVAQEFDDTHQQLGIKRLNCGGCFSMMKVPVTRLLKRSMIPTSSLVLKTNLWRLFLNDESPGDKVAQEVGDAHQQLGIKKLTCGGCFSMMKVPVTRLLSRSMIPTSS